MSLFGSPEFFEEYKDAINGNEDYAEAASDWEGSFLFVVELDEETKEAFTNLTKMAEDNEEVEAMIENMVEGYEFTARDLEEGKVDELAVYLDLWHGKCREIKTKDIGEIDADNELRGPYDVWKMVAIGEIDPVQAIMQNKLDLEGDLTKIMRYTRGAQELVESVKSIDTQFPSDYI